MRVAIEKKELGKYTVLNVRNLFLDNAPKNVSWYEVPCDDNKPIMAYYNGKRVTFSPSMDDKLLFWDLRNAKCKRNVVDL